MDIKKRVGIILVVYVLIITFGILSERRLESELSPSVFENPSLSVQTFMDDFVRVKISCSWNSKKVNFIVRDEFGNIGHNSSVLLNCSGFKILDLQGMPQDYLADRRYMVEANFDNQSINSGYFYFEEYNSLELARKEIYSFFRFAILENRLARGAYTDAQRMLYTATGDNEFGKNYTLSHLTGFVFTLVILISIDIAIWIGHLIHKSINHKKNKPKAKKAKI